jgi:AraC-like DNA-binding protein
MAETRVSLHFTRSLIRFAVANGASFEDLCRAAGLAAGDLGNPDRTIPGHRSVAVWKLAETQTGDPHLGLHLGEHSQPAVFGLVGYLMSCSANFGDALEKLIRYLNLLTDGVTGRMRGGGAVAEVELEMAGESGNIHHPISRQQVEVSFSTLMTVSRALTGHPLQVRDVRFAYPKPEDISEHVRVFQAPVRFESSVNRLSFDAGILSAPVLTADPAMKSVFESQAERLLVQQARPERMAVRVRERLVRSVTAETPTIAAISRDLGLSERSLQRRLDAEGTSFKALLDDARRDLACLHLENPSVSVAEIAFLLGFSEPSAFHRFFKRKTGETPDGFRRRRASKSTRRFLIN